MSVLNPAAPEDADAISFESVIIETELYPKLEIAPFVTDLDVFEHLDKPYVTAILGFVDAEDAVGAINLSGGEKVTIILKTNIEDSYPVKRVYYVDKIMTSAKTGDTEEFYALHLIEDHAFISNVLNVNKAYSGKATTIVTKIAKEFLDVKVNASTTDLQDSKVIVPNLSPIDAMCWMKNKATTTDGYPFYLFSTLVEPGLQMHDLRTLLSADTMNAGKPYVYYESQLSEKSTTGNRRIIMAYQSKDTHDVYKLLNDGLIGGEYRYLDTIKKEDHKFEFDIDSEVISNLKKDDIVSKIPLYDSVRYDWSSDKIKSRKITRVAASKVFDENKSLSERDEIAHYRLNEVSRSMSRLLTAGGINFIVNGLDFFDGLEATTIGNKLEIKFLRNVVTEGEDKKFDHRKSGDYLIFACKHSFTPREYTLTFSGVKLSNGEVT